jgi:hypothetical protein
VRWKKEGVVNGDHLEVTIGRPSIQENRKLICWAKGFNKIVKGEDRAV